MSSTLLETMRAQHEEIERQQRLIVKDMMNKSSTHRGQMNQSHRVGKRISDIQDKATHLVKLYQDKDNTRKDEITSMTGAGGALFSAFYDRMRDVIQYHKKFPDTPLDYVDEDALLEAQTAEEEPFRFSGEEAYGRFLDLHAHYTVYCNLNGVKKLDYLEYVRSFNDFTLLPRSTRKSPAYNDYLHALLDYLVSFHSRTQPLDYLPRLLELADQDFEKMWDAGKVPGWEPVGGDGNAGGAPADPLFCEACNKLFTKETVFKAHLSSKKHKKAVKRLETNPDGAAALRETSRNVEKATARLEAHISRVLEQLSEIKESTQEFVEMKQSRTAAEIAAELNADEVVEDGSDEDEEEVIYNPHKVPLDFDGKPIPYWLFKLHGLNIEFKCEICGNYSYMGRRNFERHFQEWRHAYGMKCLNIPNTRHFQEITQIADAQALWEKIQKDEAQAKFVPEQDEEFEDGDGNVFNKKTYDDLRKQGLL